MIAVCATKTASKDGDLYLDDEVDSAIRRKLEIDYASEGVYSGSIDREVAALMAVEEEE